MNLGYDWNEGAVARLEALWAEGHSTAEIGRRLGCSKNAVVGKAHRIGLSRPSPIPLPEMRKPTPPQTLRQPGALKAIRERRTLEPLAPKVRILASRRTTQPPPTRLALQLRSHAGLVARIAPAVRMPEVHVGAAKECQFPMWGDEKPTHIYCGAPIERDEIGAPTGPYCAAHREKCHVVVRVRAEATP